MLKILETIWLIISIFGFLLTGYSLLPGRFEKDDTIWFLIISLVALGMFFIRRKQRLQRERNL